MALQSLQGLAIKYISQDEMKWYEINIQIAELGKISVIYFTWRKHVMRYNVGARAAHGQYTMLYM